MTDKTTSAIVERVIVRVAELPDRTSPDDWPEAMLVTSEELKIILTDEFADTITERLFADAIKPRLRGCFEPLSKDHFESWLDNVAVSLARDALAAR